MIAELRAKLDAPNLDLDLSPMRSSDTAGITRSYKQLIEAGVHPDDAAAVTGITLTRPTREPNPVVPPSPGDDA